ncbi:CPW-WPC family protein, putative [Plasmodium gallinaceum]|uniref:CPW-WPC family protein, putative n=1 Tax=Plasmodium gallinaceum TaxID=5849 RepID=A0A1J1GRY5_PLAGA|nr:CPW-WPC family protein, putative [Plasmodium gallinaceum]CRG95038.1 CPW-WPC family protein, putative [Plasmodium gallinaceum]
MSRHNFFMIIIALIGIINTIFCIPFNQNENKKVESSLSSNGLLKNVVKHSPKISEEEINKSEIKIIKKAHEEENKKLTKLGKCIKDYTLSCPKYWTKNTTENGKITCVADSEYNGFCITNQSFENFTENDKMNFESSCNVEWPCKTISKDTCEDGKKDYNNPCPEGFLVQDDNSCKADITVYRGMCNSNNIKFTHMSDEEKENWSISCEAYWPCYKECSSEQFLSNCPKDWNEINLYECIPTQNYRGICKGKKNFKYFTISMKKSFEEKCKTRFLCSNSCEKNYEQDCPMNWLAEKGYCLAPHTFDLCNKKKLSIENLTTKDKQFFEKECSVNWPCKKKNFCEMDWNFECPENWEKEYLKNQKEQYICKSPSLYKGKCNNIFLTNNSNEYIKREVASNCNAPWPCIDEKKKNSFDPTEHKINNQDNFPNEINGPITQEGKIYEKKKYTIEDRKNSSFFDIMI